MIVTGGYSIFRKYAQAKTQRELLSKVDQHIAPDALQKYMAPLVNGVIYQPKRKKRQRIIRPIWDIIPPPHHKRLPQHRGTEDCSRNPFLPTCQDFYASPTGVAGNAGTEASPWNLRKCFSGGSGAIDPGDDIVIRAGTYYGVFPLSVSGTALAPVRIRPYPGEAYLIDQYATATLTTGINATQTGILMTTADLANFPSSYQMVIDGDNGPGLPHGGIPNPATPQSNVAESVRISSGTAGGKNIERALNGTGQDHASDIGFSHDAGALIWLTAPGIDLTGSYLDIWGTDPTGAADPWIYSGLTNTNPIRTFDPNLGTQDPLIGKTGPSWQRGASLFFGTNVTQIRLYFLQLRDGANDAYFLSGTGGDHYTNGLLCYNNGHVDEIRGHGQALYIHTPSSATFLNMISFNNFASGMKFYGVTGDVNNVIGRQIFSWNNGCTASYTGNPAVDQPLPTNKYCEGNMFIGTEAGEMIDCECSDSVFWNPLDAFQVFQQVKLGHGNYGNGLLFDNNWIVGGDQTFALKDQRTLIFTNNTIVNASAGSQSRQAFNMTNTLGTDKDGYTWSGNTFYDDAAVLGTDVRTYPHFYFRNGSAQLNELGGGNLAYDVAADARDWLGSTTLALNYITSLPTGTQFFVAPCAPDQVNRYHLGILQWDASTTVSITTTVFGQMDFEVGDDYRMENAMDTADFITGTYSGSALTFSVDQADRSVQIPVGFTTEDARMNSWGANGGFGVLIVYRITQVEPTLSIVAPDTGAKGTAVNVTLTGNDFVIGATTITVGGTGVTITSETVLNSTTMTATFTIAAGTGAGPRLVRVTTAEGTSDDLIYFTITTPPDLSTVIWCGA